MKQILGITSDAKQIRTFVLDDGSSFNFTMYYSPTQQGWFISELVYGTFILCSIRITNQPNFLYQFKNRIPFGLACAVDGGREATLQEDFSSDAAKLYVLSRAEVNAYAEFLSGA